MIPHWGMERIKIMSKLFSRETIMPQSRAEEYEMLFHLRYEKALNSDVFNLISAIKKFKSENITVWHCCTYGGVGYYTVSDGTNKRYVPSYYELECVGGCWSCSVYERLYMGQLHLMKYLEAVKSEICDRCFVEMPLKCLYIDYILFDFDKEKDGLSDFYNKTELTGILLIANKYRKDFTDKYSEQVNIYNNMVSQGYSYWDYYNGLENKEFDCIANIIDKAVNEIYKNRDSLEACELWEKARKAIYSLDDIKRDTVYPSDYMKGNDDVYNNRTRDKRYIKLRRLILQWGDYSGSIFDKPCDEAAAKNDLLTFYGALIKCKPDKHILKDMRGYYAYLINIIPFQQALAKRKYSLACHELETLFVSHPILQPRIYYNLIRLGKKYLNIADK